MNCHHREHPDIEPNDATERLHERADRLHDEMKDRAWEAALEKDAGPWDGFQIPSDANKHQAMNLTDYPTPIADEMVRRIPFDDWHRVCDLERRLAACREALQALMRWSDMMDIPNEVQKMCHDALSVSTPLANLKE